MPRGGPLNRAATVDWRSKDQPGSRFSPVQLRIEAGARDPVSKVTACKRSQIPRGEDLHRREPR